MKTSMKTKRLLVLGILLLSFLLSACAPTVPQETTSSDETSGTAGVGETTGTGENAENKDNGTEEKKEGFWSGEDLMFTAATYHKDPFMSSEFTMTVVVYDHRVYIDRDWKYKITYTENMDLTYRKQLFMNFTDSKDDDKIKETLERIQNLKSCYILESYDISGKKTLLYELDGTYYFVELDQDNEAYYICAGTVNDQSRLAFYPELYLRSNEELSKVFWLSITDGEIKINSYSYQKATDIENLELRYSDALLAAANGDAEILKTLDTIKNQKPYCILKSSNDTDKEDMGYILAIYEIDDVYYFLDCYQSGDIPRIWIQSYRG